MNTRSQEEEESTASNTTHIDNILNKLDELLMTKQQTTVLKEKIEKRFTLRNKKSRKGNHTRLFEAVLEFLFKTTQIVEADKQDKTMLDNN